MQQSPQENLKFNFEYKEPISMCNQQGHVKSDKVNNIVVNGIDREEVMIIDNCFEKAKLNESKMGKQMMSMKKYLIITKNQYK